MEVQIMRVVERIEKEVKQMTREELAGLRDWFINFDSNIWDEQIEMDIKAGRLDALAIKAIKEHKLGKTREI